MSYYAPEPIQTKDSTLYRGLFLSAALGTAVGVALFAVADGAATFLWAPALKAIPTTAVQGIGPYSQAPFSAGYGPTSVRPWGSSNVLQASRYEDPLIINPDTLQQMMSVSGEEQKQLVGERLVVLISKDEPRWASEVTSKLLDDLGAAACIALMQDLDALEVRVDAELAKLKPKLLSKPDPEAAATYRVLPVEYGRAAFVTQNWWKETREQYKGFGVNPGPEVLKLLRIRSETAAALGRLSPALLNMAKEQKANPDTPIPMKVLFSIKVGGGSGVLGYTNTDGVYEITYLVANTMLPSESDTQLSLVNEIAKQAREAGASALRLSPAVPPTLFGEPSDFGFDDDTLEYSL